MALLDAVLAAGGYRVGAFTSPHLVDYRERIRIAGRWVSEASLIAAFERIADALGDDSLTFFEFNTLAALLVFETAAPDAVVLEVGLGGRLDAVNVVDADVAVIVSVGLDIFRAGRPAVCGMTGPPASVLEAAAVLGSALRLRGRDFDGEERGDGRWNYRDARGLLDGLPLPALQGAVQVGNAATALAALRELAERLPLARDAVERGLSQVRLPGRFQRVVASEGFEWVLDVAHNPDAAAILAANLARHPTPGRTFAVCGMLSDKDVPAVLSILGNSIDRWFAASTDGPRGLGDAELSARASAAGIVMTPSGSVPDAMLAAAREARRGDRIVVFGSFHTVGPALSCV